MFIHWTVSLTHQGKVLTKLNDIGSTFPCDLCLLNLACLCYHIGSLIFLILRPRACSHVQVGFLRKNQILSQSLLHAQTISLLSPDLVVKPSSQWWLPQERWLAGLWNYLYCSSPLSLWCHFYLFQRMQRRYGLVLRQGMCSLIQIQIICRSTRFVGEMDLQGLCLLNFLSLSIPLDSAEPGKCTCGLDELSTASPSVNSV